MQTFINETNVLKSKFEWKIEILSFMYWHIYISIYISCYCYILAPFVHKLRVLHKAFIRLHYLKLT